MDQMSTGYTFNNNNGPGRPSKFQSRGFKGSGSNGNDPYADGADAFMGEMMPNGENGCVDAVVRIGSFYDPFLKGELDKGVAGVEKLCVDAGDRVIPFDADSLEKGDVIVYGHRDHVVTYDGGNGYVGNSSSQLQVVHGSDYNSMGGLTPTEIIKTPSGGDSTPYQGNGTGNKGGNKNSKKPRTVLDLFGHVSKIMSDVALAGISGTVYTGTPWDDEGSGGSSSSRGGSAGSMGQQANEKQVYDYFISRGYSPEAAAGIMGRMKREHGFQTSDVPLTYVDGVGECGGLGMFQWTGSRAEEMRQYAASTNRSYDDVGAQLDFMVDEAARRGDATPENMNGMSPEDAASYFTAKYEVGKPGGDEEGYARDYYNQFAGGGKGERKFVGGGGFGDMLNRVWKGRMKKYGFLLSHGESLKEIEKPGWDKRVDNAMQKEAAAKANALATILNPAGLANKKSSVAEKVDPNAITGYTPGIVQADTSTFTGGEYFNDPTKVTQAAKDYITGKSSLEDVAKSVGFKDIPTPDTPLTVQQQQQLGFREYSPIRTWAHYLTESYLWKNSGMTSVESWMKGKDPIAQPIYGNRPEGQPGSAVEKVNTQVPSGDATQLVKTYENKGNSNAESFLAKMVELLTAVASNTSGIGDGFDKIAGKGVILNASGRNGNMPNVVMLPGNSGIATDQLLSPNGNKAVSDEYALNAKIAAGGEFKR